MNYIPNTDGDRARMLADIGIKDVQELFGDIPAGARLKGAIDLPVPLDEIELSKELKKLSGRNTDTGKMLSFLGAGAYNHFIPAVVKHIVSRSEFYTAYTPYQPEMSQGMLQAIYEYQTMICRLTGMDAANASLYDGATAVAEAANLSAASTKRTEILISNSVNPVYRKVLKTYCSGESLTVKETGFSDGVTDIKRLKEQVSDKTACLIIQQPNFFGCIEDVFEAGRIIHEAGGLFVVSVDPVSLGILKKPSDYGADIVTGEGQPLGNQLNFGGPYLGLFAAKKELARLMPGRIAGMTTDTNGKRGFVLTLQTREQHIRREKATSNICSNEALCALSAAVYLSAMGRAGLSAAARICMDRAAYARKKISSIQGYSTSFSSPVFKEFAVRTPKPVSEVNRALYKKGIIGGYDLGRDHEDLKNNMLLCFTEMNSTDDIDRLAAALKDA